MGNTRAKLTTDNVMDFPQLEGKKALLRGEPFPVPKPISVDEAISVMAALRAEVLKDLAASVAGHQKFSLFGGQSRPTTPAPAPTTPAATSNDTKQEEVTPQKRGPGQP